MNLRRQRVDEGRHAGGSLTALARSPRDLTALSRFSDNTFLLTVCALNVVLRIPLLLIAVTPMSDFGWYYGRAMEIASGGGYAEHGVPTAFWPVGWPAFLAGLLWLFGAHVGVGQIANLVLSVLVIGLIAAIGKRLFPYNQAWRLAVLLIAIYPNQICYVPLLSVEIFFEFLLLLGFLLLMSRSVIKLICAGLVFGVATLTKTQALFIPAVFAVPILASRPGWPAFRRWLTTVALTGAATLVVVLPWTTRNYAEFETMIPVSTNGGFTLLTGNNPSASGGYTPDDPLVADLSHDPRNQVEMDRIATQRARRWIASHPAAFTRLVPAKIWALWSGDGEAEWFYQMGYNGYSAHAILFRTVRILNQIFYVLLLGAALVALPGLVRQRRALNLWCFSGWAGVVYFTIISTVFSGQSRFHFVLMPFIAMYAAYALTRSPTPTEPALAATA
jgi:hypothetical protein